MRCTKPYAYLGVIPCNHHSVLRRHGVDTPAVVRPVRDCAARDLALACRMWRLGTAPRAGAMNPRGSRGRPSLNGLAAAFVVGLQAALPSTVPTLLRTALKLQAFPFNRLPGAGVPAGGCAASRTEAQSAAQGSFCGPGGGSAAAGERMEHGVAADNGCAASQACACGAAAESAVRHGGDCMPAASRCAASQAKAPGADAESAGRQREDSAAAAIGCAGSPAHAQSAVLGAGSGCGGDSAGAALRLCAVCAAPLSGRDALGAHERSLSGQGPEKTGPTSGGPRPGCGAPAVHPAGCRGSGAGASAAGEAAMHGDAAAQQACDFGCACCYACRQLILAPPQAAAGAAGVGSGAGERGVASLLPQLLRGTACAAGCLRLPPAGSPGSPGRPAARQALRAQIAEYLLDGA